MRRGFERPQPAIAPGRLRYHWLMRHTGIDLLRVVGIAAVVLGHVFAGPETHQWIYPWHVPVFFFLTGYFWKPDRTIRDELRNRSRTLLLPYLTWLLVGFGVLAVLGDLTTGHLLAALRGGVNLGGVFGAFWFVMTLFFTTILYRLVERSPVIAWGIASAGLLIAYLFPGVLGATPQSIGLAAPCLVFVLAGRFARNHQPAQRVLAGSVLLTLTGLAILLAPVGNINLKPADFGTPVLGVLVSIAASWGLTLLFSQIKAPAFVTELAHCGIAVVLFHTAVITALSGAPQAVVALAALFVPWTVALLLRRTPLAVVSTGQRYSPTELTRSVQ